MSRRTWLAVALGVLPWTWFLIRDHLGSLGDQIGIGLPALVVPTLAAVLLNALWMRWREVAPIAVSWALVFAIAIFAPRLPSGMGAPVDPVTLLSANFRFDNPQHAAAAADLLAQEPDVLVVPEATKRLVRELRPHFAHVELFEQEFEKNNYGVAVFSNLPLRDVRELPLGNGVLRVEVGGPHRFVLFATHLSRPVLSPKHRTHVSHAQNHQQVERLHWYAAQEDLPVVIAGDLNLSDRTRGYRLLADDFTDVARDGWAATTYTAGVYRLFLLRIDYVFASHGWCGDRVDDVAITGSDHRGVRVDIGPCR